MKKTFVSLLLICFVLLGLFPAGLQATGDESIIFLHHSTGGGVYNGGNVPAWFNAYNSSHATSYQIRERSYPHTPYSWNNYPYDYWNLWLNGQCNSSNSNIECMDTLAASNDVIIYKHCYPGASVLADTGSPLVSSSRKSLENYKLQYRALREMMDSYPDNIFIIWTLAPLHRLATNSADADRAKQFVDWVKGPFLSEDGKSHPNIFIFDFWGDVAGADNFLRYEYEGSHTSSDSHPNALANQTVGPVFGQFIVSAIDEFDSSSSSVAPVVRADVDLSGAITTADALLTLRKSLGMSMLNTAWKETATTGDVDCSGSISSADALLILRKSLGMSMTGTGWCE